MIPLSPGLSNPWASTSKRIKELDVPLAQVARAHDLIEEGSVVGNVVLEIP